MTMARISINSQPAQRIRFNDFVAFAPVLMLVDAFVVWVCGHGLIVYFATQTWRAPMLGSERYELYVAVSAMALPMVMQALGAYRVESVLSLRRAFFRNLLSWAVVFTSGIVLMAAFKESERFSRLWLGVWGGSVLLNLFLFQVLYWYILSYRRAHGVGMRRVAIVGNGGQAQRIVREMLESSDHAFKPVLYFGDFIDLPGGLSSSGSIEEAPEKLKSKADEIDEVWLLHTARLKENTAALMHSDELNLFDIRVVPDTQGFTAQSRNIECMGSHLLVGLSTSPHQGMDGALKTAMDRVGSALLLTLLSPMLLVIAMLIRIDSSGPVLYRQIRHGLNGREFTIYKFRTMFLSLSHRPGEALKQVSRNDLRVTRVGRILRQWSIDEFPQLFNVLRGEMSLIGPRPHEVGMNRDAAMEDFRYRLRHRVKPGMSGWAQVHGFRGPAVTATHIEERLKLDLWYVDHWSIWLDIRILFLTLIVGFTHKNAF